MGNLLFSLKITDLLFTYIVAEKEIMEKMIEGKLNVCALRYQLKQKK